MKSSELFKGERKVDSLRLFVNDLSAFVGKLKEEDAVLEKGKTKNLFLRMRRDEQTESFFDEVYESLETAYRHLDMNAVFQLHATLSPNWMYSQFTGPSEKGTFFVSLQRLRVVENPGGMFNYSSSNGTILPRVFATALLQTFVADVQDHRQSLIKESFKR